MVAYTAALLPSSYHAWAWGWVAGLLCKVRCAWVGPALNTVGCRAKKALSISRSAARPPRPTPKVLPNWLMAWSTNSLKFMTPNTWGKLEPNTSLVSVL